jgi:hypothetical protein
MAPAIGSDSVTASDIDSVLSLATTQSTYRPLTSVCTRTPGSVRAVRAPSAICPNSRERSVTARSATGTSGPSHPRKSIGSPPVPDDPVDPDGALVPSPANVNDDSVRGGRSGFPVMK